MFYYKCIYIWHCASCEAPLNPTSSLIHNQECVQEIVTKVHKDLCARVCTEAFIYNAKIGKKQMSNNKGLVNKS